MAVLLLPFVAAMFMFLFLLVSIAQAADVGCGKDTDRNGSVDVWCPHGDQDLDGFADGEDCDPQDSRMYPGISQACGSGGWQTCQSNGQFTTCNEVDDFCEATGSGTCYYIDPTSGSDSNNGLSVATAWQTPAKLVTYYSGGDQPAGYVNVDAGDAIYVLDGTSTFTFTWTQDSSTRAWAFRARDGDATNRIILSAYPGHNPVIDPDCGANCSAIYLPQSDYWTVRGLRLEGAQHGIDTFNDAVYGHIYEINKFTDIRGNGDNNVAGIQCHSLNNAEIRNNEFWGLGTSSGNQTNVGHIDCYGGNNVRIHHNYADGSADPSSDNFGFRWKHASTTLTHGAEYSYNVVSNIRGHGLIYIQQNTNAFNNYIYNSGGNCARIRTVGGVANFRGFETYNNTCRSPGSACFYFKPDETYSSIPATDVYNLTKNICAVDHDTITCGNERSLIAISQFETSSTIQAKLESSLVINDNGFYSSATEAQYGWFCSGGLPESTHGNLAAFVAATGYCADCVEGDPAFSSAGVATNASMDEWGWLADTIIPSSTAVYVTASRVETFAPGEMDRSIYVELLNQSQQAVTGKSYNDFALSYVRSGALPVTVSLQPLASAQAAHTNWGLVEVGADAPGIYRLDIGDAALASGVDRVTFTLTQDTLGYRIFGILASGTDVNVVSVGGSAVSSANDFKASLAGISTFDPSTDTVTLGTNGLPATAITADAASKVADVTWRRHTSNVEASSHGDAITFKSPYGAIAAQVHRHQIADGQRTIYRSNDSTSLATTNVTSDANATPITGVNTP